ncbi:MAG TPA: pyridoxamine 5'-phosphate oxidase [Steroidobacter sp.]|jgi:pyridoxamine 5'-phosphate oxidase|nr:pyridoxamine 5'-phosphate oxidase [Steroidobacteraceae bacterium]HLS80317.1 pyridoxamine 5'-phosphate oxidase [Steroidobacter sp.]
MSAEEGLPEPLPAEPLSLLRRWFQQACELRLQPNPDAMTLATVGADGGPSARVVLCKHLCAEHGYVVFYTNYQSRKGRELLRDPRAAAVFHWDALQRQVRIEGRVVRSPAEESDQYFATRPLQSRIGAWASLQSEPLASRATLLEQVRKAQERLGVPPDAADAATPRPPHWGGYRLWIESIELWAEGQGRIHDRAVWRRRLTGLEDGSFDVSSWSSTRLNP